MMARICFKTALRWDGRKEGVRLNVTGYESIIIKVDVRTLGLVFYSHHLIKRTLNFK